MSDIKVASRYAKSLLDLSIERKIEAEVKKDIELYINVLKGNSELGAVINNPIITLDKKKAIISALFADKFNAETISFFNLMIDKGRASTIKVAALEYVNQFNVYKNIVTVKVVSASALDEAAKQEVINKVKAITAGEVLLETSINEDLIGGLILTIGDTQFDASISSRLSKLKKAFSTSAVA